jgi:hypothetical protein
VCGMFRWPVAQMKSLLFQLNHQAMSKTGLPMMILGESIVVPLGPDQQWLLLFQCVHESTGTHVNPEGGGGNEAVPTVSLFDSCHGDVLRCLIIIIITVRCERSPVVTQSVSQSRSEPTPASGEASPHFPPAIDPLRPVRPDPLGVHDPLRIGPTRPHDHRDPL